METPVIYQDNQSTIALVAECSTPHRNKYFLVRQEAVKQAVVAGDFKINYLQTGEMTADILTKPLQGALFRNVRSKLLNGDNIHLLSCEKKKVRDEKTDFTPDKRTVLLSKLFPTSNVQNVDSSIIISTNVKHILYARHVCNAYITM